MSFNKVHSGVHIYLFSSHVSLLHCTLVPNASKKERYTEKRGQKDVEKHRHTANVFLTIITEKLKPLKSM